MVQRLGSGTFGTVFLGKRVGRPQIVAIKVAAVGSAQLSRIDAEEALKNEVRTIMAILESDTSGLEPIYWPQLHAVGRILETNQYAMVRGQTTD